MVRIDKHPLLYTYNGKQPQSKIKHRDKKDGLNGAHSEKERTNQKNMNRTHLFIHRERQREGVRDKEKQRQAERERE